MSKVTHGDIYGLWEECYPNVDGFINALIRQNVIIQRGNNRHPYADVLHEWIEGVDVEFENPHKLNEYLPLHQGSSCDVTLKFRIKPKEPIYEWQWCVIMDDGTGSIYGYHTEESMKDMFKNKQKVKIEATKRERKTN